MQLRNRRAGVEDRWHRVGDGEPCTDKGHGKLGTLAQSKSHGVGKRWRARYVDENSKEHAKSFARKTDAQDWLDEITAAFTTGTYIDPQRGKITFASFYKGWSARQVWVSGTQHAMDLAANNVTFGNVTFGDLRMSHIEEWVKRMQDRGLEATTIRTRFSNVRSVIRAAVKDRVAPRDVTVGVKLPRVRKSAAAMSIPTAKEVGATIRATTDIEPTYGAFIAVCAFAGLRRGEASALKISDVDFMRREIHVQRQVQWTDDGRMEIRGPKYGSERTIFAPEGMVTILAEHVRLYRGGDDPDRWLFPSSRDKALPAHAATVGRWWRIVRQKVNIDYRLHDLRHFYASGLIAAGCDVVTVQRALGHSSASVTLDTYGHLWPDANDRTRKAAEGLVEQALGTTADALRTDA
ncbi:tyrosine-type recombinase/integrase [Mycolicibacter virginiensis]|uniref:Site-specific integrase n=1 Tax=Mycolicibacter virginiensis TaxID=1795032 RepID=A0A9X7NYH5_9MYCO|nr:site-specific integrase [Mycolicibacter virginiensis]PQM52027.1 site-specific integrase [Mycolicibacter virginiensis]ULP47346.1 site-specific integrase [Mycolicibacter virginiensis]